MVNLHKTIFESDYWNNRTGSPKLEFNFLLETPKFDTYQVNFFPYYWYDGFVDKHRPGIGFWSGNPFTNHWFAKGHLFYATGSGNIGYKFNLSNRTPRVIGNYADWYGEVEDDDGLKRISLGSEIYFQDANDYRRQTTLTLKGQRVDLYSTVYSDTAVFEKANYNNLSAALTFSGSAMLTWWKAALSTEYNAGAGVDFGKISAEFSYHYRFGKSYSLSVHAFSGAVFGDQVPSQELVYTGGGVDPKHESFAISRQGKYAPLHTFYYATGMAMPGFSDAQNPWRRGKAGSALSVDLKLGYLPTIYGSAGWIAEHVNAYSKAPVLFETGVKLNVGSTQLVFPLYINRPAPGEKALDIRFKFSSNIQFKLGSLQ